MSAVPEVDLMRIRRFCDSRVPAHLRDEAHVDAGVRGTIFDCRPPWHPDLQEWSRVPVAQLRYLPEAHLWSLHWADRHGGWHAYQDRGPGAAAEILDEIASDPTAILGLTEARQKPWTRVAAARARDNPGA